MSREKVLIVEDEENERTGLAELISSWGYVAETARDGQEGFEKVNLWSPSIVITDLKMPRMGGLGAAGENRRRESEHCCDRGNGSRRDRERRRRPCEWARMTTSLSPSIPAACVRFCRMRLLCWAYASNVRSLAENCETLGHWGRWSAPPRRCRRFSGSPNWSRPVPLRS